MSSENTIVEPKHLPETAIIKVNPAIDERFISLHSEARKLRQAAMDCVITSDEDVKRVTNDLSILSRLKKTIEEKRKDYTAPINDHLKFINECFKILSTPLDEADQITRKKIILYRAEEKRKADEIAEINRLRQEAAAREAILSGTGEITEPTVFIEPPAAPATTVRTESGTLGTTHIWKGEVIDFALLPDEYKTVDYVKLGKVIRAGLHSIPGVRIWEEESLKISPR